MTDAPEKIPTLMRFGRGLPDPLPRWADFPRYNFVGGHNDPDRIPVAALAAAAAAALNAHARRMALYNLGAGPMGFEDPRDGIARRLVETRGVTISREPVLVTSGSGQGLDLVNAALVELGDTVILEEFTYSGALNKARKSGAKVVGAPLDARGLDVERLGAMLDAMAREGVRPKYVYTSRLCRWSGKKVGVKQTGQTWLALADHRQLLLEPEVPCVRRLETSASDAFCSCGR